MNTARKGNKGENIVADDYTTRGWVYGSRRHLLGPGDGIAYRRGSPTQLVEVKYTKGPFDHFGPKDRQAMRDYAFLHDLEPLLAWIHRDQVQYIPISEWP